MPSSGSPGWPSGRRHTAAIGAGPYRASSQVRLLLLACVPGDPLFGIEPMWNVGIDDRHERSNRSFDVTRASGQTGRRVPPEHEMAVRVGPCPLRLGNRAWPTVASVRLAPEGVRRFTSVQCSEERSDERADRL